MADAPLVGRITAPEGDDLAWAIAHGYVQPVDRDEWFAQQDALDDEDDYRRTYAR